MSTAFWPGSAERRDKATTWYVENDSDADRDGGYPSRRTWGRWDRRKERKGSRSGDSFAATGLQPRVAAWPAHFRIPDQTVHSNRISEGG